MKKVDPDGNATYYVGGTYEVVLGPTVDGRHWGVDGVGSLVTDGSGYEEHGQVRGPQWVEGGVSDRALDFDGVNDYVAFDNEPAIEGELTVGAWVRPEQAPTGLGRMVAGTYAHNGGGSNRRGWALGNTYGSTDRFSFQVFDETGSYGIASLDGFFDTYQDEWVYVTGVFKPGESVALYVDGEKVAEDVTGVPTEIGLSGLFEIGSRADNVSQGHWDGQIDEVRVVGRALSQGEIEDLVQAGSGAGQFHPAYVTSAIKYYRYCAMSSCQVVAMRKDGEVTYMHGDHLGSTSLTTNGAGGFEARVLYYPYGEERYVEGTLQTDFGYTGQRNEGFGLYDYKARFYDPALGRFISADAIVPGIGSQALNRYMYVEGNPCRHTDPTGHCIGVLGGGDTLVCVGVVVGLVVVVGVGVFVLAPNAEQNREAASRAWAGVWNNAVAQPLQRKMDMQRAWYTIFYAAATHPAESLQSLAGGMTPPPNPLDPDRNKQLKKEHRVKGSNGKEISEFDSIEQTPEGEIWRIEEKSATWAQDEHAWAQKNILNKGHKYVNAIENGVDIGGPASNNIGFRFTNGPLSATLQAEVEAALQQLAATYPDYNFVLLIQ